MQRRIDITPKSNIKTLIGKGNYKHMEIIGSSKYANDAAVHAPLEVGADVPGA